MRIRIAAFSLALFAVAFAVEARAGLITDHAIARALAVRSGFGSGDGPNQGPLGASAFAFTQGPSNGYPGGNVNAVAMATSGGGGTFGWSLQASASLGITNGGSGSAEGIATWRDLIYLSSYSPAIVGNTLRLTFQSSGSLALGNPVTGSTSVKMTATAQHSTAFRFAEANANLTFLGLETGGFDTLTGTPDGFRGTFHLDIPIHQGVSYQGIADAIYYDVRLNALASFQTNTNGSGSASDPTQFLSITLPDVGNVTPESLGVSITFDSGIASPNVQAVPEPGSLAMLAAGAICLLGYGRGRRQRTAA